MRNWSAALIVLGLTGALVFIASTAGRSLEGDDMMRLAYLGILASFVGIGFFTGGMRNIRADLKAFAFWIIALVAVSGAYALRHDFLAFGQRLTGALAPGHVSEREGEIRVTRGSSGMFMVDGKVNGTPVRFMFDTGASGLSLTAEDARRAGIVTRDSDFSLDTATANGVTKVAPVLVDTVSIGSAAFSRVQATVSRPGALRTSLLGHSVLDRLASYEVRGDQLILRTR